MGTGGIVGADLTLTSSAPLLTFNDSDDDPFVLKTEGDDDFHIYNTVSGDGALVKLFTADGDGSDTIGIHIFGVGTTATQTNLEALKIEYNSNIFQIYESRGGTGVARPFRLSAGSVATDQIRMSTYTCVGINLSSPAAQLHIDQRETDGAIPVLTLDQADESEGLINFIGLDRGVIDEGTSSTESIRVEINGVVRRIALYAD